MKHDAEPRETRATREAFLGSYKSKLAMFILRQRLAQLSHEAQPRVMSASCRAGSYYVTTEKDAFALNIGLMPNNPQAGIDAAIEIVEIIFLLLAMLYKSVPIIGCSIIHLYILAVLPGIELKSSRLRGLIAII